MPAALKARPLPAALLLSLVPVGLWFIVRPLLEPAPPLPALHASVGYAIFGFLGSIYLVPALGPILVQKNFFGRDLLKPRDDSDAGRIPESLGLVCASIYILLLIVFIPFPFSESFAEHRTQHAKSREGLVAHEFPHHQLSVYLASLLSLLLATMLGFLDDIFDIRWRHKIPVPIVGSIPLLTVYYAARGSTNIVVPIPLRPLLRTTLLNLGPLYYLYMSLLSTFCTNSINILAGINGAEVSQAVVIAVSVILNDLLYLPWPFDFRMPLHLLGGQAETELKFGGVYSAGMAYGSPQLVERHLFSLYFMLPFLGVCLGFLYHNWYPARAFPGDTFCYLAGMTFAVVGIQAHFSKTLLLFFLPQIFNFLLSCPQLFGLVPCPRHRVPRFDASSGLLHPSTADLTPQPGAKTPSPGKARLTALVLRLLTALRMTELTTDPKTGAVTACTNLTILNFLLLRLGPMREEALVRTLIGVQVAGSVTAFVVRYGLVRLVYDGDRR